MVPPSIAKRFKTKFLVHTFPTSFFYCSSNNQYCKVMNFFQFLFEGVIKRFIKNYVCIDKVIQMFCRLQAIGSLIVLRKVFLLALLFCCVYLINMLIETKLAIQDNTQVFLSGRSQYIVVVENERWRQRFFTSLRKIYFCCMLIYVRIKQHFPLVLTKSLLMSILLVSMS